MKISAIVASSDNGVIAKDGVIPWSMPADFARFKEITMGSPMIMGRSTHEYIGRTLPGRLNIVVSRNARFKVFPGSILATSIEEALNMDQIKGADEVFILGGQSIYEAAMPYVQKIYLTRIHTTIEGGDRFFEYEPGEWLEVSRESHSKDKENPYDYDFIVLERKDAIK